MKEIETNNNVPSRTPEEIKKGLECWVDDIPCDVICAYTGVQPYDDCRNTIMKDALAYIKQLEAQIPKWISYKEKSPQEAGYYLVHCIHWYSDTAGYECYKVACFDPKILWVNIENLLKVTHWMPLPSRPKEE